MAEVAQAQPLVFALAAAEEAAVGAVLDQARSTSSNQIEPIGKRTVVEELRRAYDKLCAGSDVLDDKLQNLLASSSLIIALAASVQVTALRDRGGIGFWLAGVAVVVLYILLLVTVFKSVNPLTYGLPVSRDWKVLSEFYFDEDENATLNQLISDYLRSIEQAITNNDAKSRGFQASVVLFALIITALLTMLALGVAAT